MPKRALAADVIARIEAADSAELDIWVERVVTASNLDDVLGPPPHDLRLLPPLGRLRRRRRELVLYPPLGEPLGQPLLVSRSNTRLLRHTFLLFSPPNTFNAPRIHTARRTSRTP